MSQHINDLTVRILPDDEEQPNDRTVPLLPDSTAIGHIYYKSESWRDTREAYVEALEVYQKLSESLARQSRVLGWDDWCDAKRAELLHHQKLIQKEVGNLKTDLDKFDRCQQAKVGGRAPKTPIKATPCNVWHLLICVIVLVLMILAIVQNQYFTFAIVVDRAIISRVHLFMCAALWVLQILAILCIYFILKTNLDELDRCQQAKVGGWAPKTPIAKATPCNVWHLLMCAVLTLVLHILIISSYKILLQHISDSV